MDFGNLLKRSWDLFLKEIVQLILFTVVAVVLSLTIILIPTVTGGLARGFLGYAREGRRPEFSELWNFEQYGQILLLIIVGGVLISIGYMLLIIPGIVLNVWWLYALFFLVDRKMNFWQSMEASRAAVGASGFINNFVVLLIAFLLSAVGSAVWIGTLLTTPFIMVMVALVYLQVSGGTAQA